EEIAERFAAEGFIAAAPDLYSGATARDAAEAGKLMSGLDQRKAIDDLTTVVAHLRSIEGVEAVGITGFCMGGTFALLLPCYTRLEASVPFYGDVPEDTSVLANLSSPVLFIGGENDEWINLEKMKRLEDALKKYHKAGEVRIYKDAPHAFFNDTRHEVYRAADAEDAWRRAIEFFNLHLRSGRSAAGA
ncbi:MAG: dienelactone hydrolase family protein, partial [Acidobacteriota bacterium]